jgi:hypothetical protein
LITEWNQAIDMRVISKISLLLPLTIILLSSARAGQKKISGLIFQSSQNSKTPCVYSPIHIWQEPNAFFQDLKQVNVKGTTEYRHGKDVVATFPDELTLRVEIARGPATMPTCGMIPNFDSATVQFWAEWRNGSQRILAKGIVVRTDWEASAVWCEDNCGGYWEYELRINSENVPLKDRLVVSMDTEKGTQIAEYIGELSTTGPDQMQSSLSLLP